MHARRLLSLTFFGGFLAALAACRSIVGVAELELTDGGSSSGSNGDASVTDAGGGTDAEAGSALGDADVPDSAATMCRTSGECRKCCKDTFKSLPQETEIGNRQCFCTGPNACAPCTSDTYCTSPTPGPPSPGGQCTPCIDETLAKGACAETCKNPECLAGLSCIKNCP